MVEKFGKDFPFVVMRRTWQPVAISAKLPPGGLLGYTLLGIDLVIARFPDEQLLATDVACPHNGSCLSAGSIRDDLLTCAHHGWSFASDGSCRSNSIILGSAKKNLKLAHLQNYAVAERYSLIWVKLDDAPLSDGRLHALPELPEFEDQRWKYAMEPPIRFAAGWRRETENYLDLSHFACAHATTVGHAALPPIPGVKIAIRSDGGFQMDAPFPAIDTQREQPGKLSSAHHRRLRFYLPNFITVRQRFQDHDERVLLHIPSPNTAESCTVFWSLTISPGFTGPEPSSQVASAVRVFDEDRYLVPINPTRGGWGVLATPSDTLAVTFQQQFRRRLHPELKASASPALRKNRRAIQRCRNGLRDDQ